MRSMFVFMTTLFLTACATTGGVWEGARPEQPLRKLHVLVDANALESEYQYSRSFSKDRNIEAESPLVVEVNRAVKQELEKQFLQAGLQVTVKTIPLRREVTKKGTTTSVTTFSLTREEMMSGLTPKDLPTLRLVIDRYQLRNNIEWTGLVGWRYELVQPALWVGEQKKDWTMSPDMVDFSDKACAADKYVACASHVVKNLIGVLREQKVISATP